MWSRYLRTRSPRTTPVDAFAQKRQLALTRRTQASLSAYSRRPHPSGERRSKECFTALTMVRVKQVSGLARWAPHGGQFDAVSVSEVLKRRPCGD